MFFYQPFCVTVSFFCQHHNRIVICLTLIFFYFLKSTLSFDTTVPFQIFFNNLFREALNMCIFGIELSELFASPRNACRVDAFVRIGMFFRAFDLDGSGFLPFTSVFCSKYLILDFKNSHLSKLSFKPYCYVFSKTSLTCWTWCSQFSLLVKMSSSRLFRNQFHQ